MTDAVYSQATAAQRLGQKLGQTLGQSPDHIPPLSPEQILAVNAAFDTAEAAATDWTHGWTSANRAAFVGALARCGTVVDAVEHVGLSRQSAYNLRARDPAFARAWDAARDQARELVVDEIYSKALDGWMEDVWYKGEKVGQRRRYDPRLLMRLLERLDRVGGHDKGKPVSGANHFGKILDAEEKGEPTDHLFEKPLWKLKDEREQALRFQDYGRAEHLQERMDALQGPKPIIICEDPACAACRAVGDAGDDDLFEVDEDNAPIDCITAAREAQEAANDPEWQAAVTEMDALGEALHGKVSVKHSRPAPPYPGGNAPRRESVSC